MLSEQSLNRGKSLSYLIIQNTSCNCVYHSYAVKCRAAVTDCDWQFSTNQVRIWLWWWTTTEL